MTPVWFYKEINALLHRNSYFSVQFRQIFDLVFLGILENEDTGGYYCHTTTLLLKNDLAGFGVILIL